jgi:3'-phosphoadenosine 5'-phosphosulfate sulfotransferase (PAPS reductase)/FAD synthetase
MKIGLAFSAGKDSFACLFLNRDRLADITVIWVNTGKAYPETLALVEHARQICPNFVEVKVDRDQQNGLRGLPADIVPIAWTGIGQKASGKKPYSIQPYLTCCYENIGMQLHHAAKEFGITHLIRGQRNDESHKSTARDGDVVDGIVYLQPIEEWDRARVLAYLADQMEVPAHFAIGHSSLDCYDCTAYAHESKDRIAYMQDKHPELYRKYITRKNKVDFALTESLKEYGL